MQIGNARPDELQNVMDRIRTGAGQKRPSTVAEQLHMIGMPTQFQERCLAGDDEVGKAGWSKSERVEIFLEVLKKAFSKSIFGRVSSIAENDADGRDLIRHHRV